MRLFDIIKKDLMLVLSDPKAMVFILLMPIVLIVILSYSLGGSFESEEYQMGIIKVAIVDNTTEDEKAIIELLMLQEMTIYALLENEELTDIITYEVTDAENAASLIESGEIDALIIIPEGFIMTITQSMIGSFGETEIEIIGSQYNIIKTNIVATIISSYTNYISSMAADKVVLSEFLQSHDFVSYVEELRADNSTELQINSEGVRRRKVVNQFFYYTIAITGMFILYSAGQGSAFLLNESKNKTLQRLFISGVSHNKLLFGKCFAIFSLCIIQLIFLFTFSTFAFSIDWGNPFIFLLTALSLALSVTGIGALLMVLSYNASSQTLGDMFMSIIVQVMALFGGSFIPLAILPKFFSYVALFTPNGLGIIAFTGNMQGAPLGEIMPYILGNVLMGGFYIALGLHFFEKKKAVR